MLARIHGCEVIDRLHEGATSVVYRGRREGDGLPVVLKVLKGVSPAPARVASLRHEYALLRELDGAGAIRAYELVEQQGRWGLLLEDFGGVSLKQSMLAGRLPLEGFLELAIALADLVEALHQRRVIHKDINPSNIVRSPDGRRLALIDLGIATMLEQETTSFGSPSVLEGTLAYMSPEQTGRMNRSLDYRTDHYSLGATLFELLTGQRVFTSEDPLELVHWHIARQPVSPRELDAGIPQVLADILLKLLAKNADERYQSMRGLRADLETCLERLRRGSLEAFPLARADGIDRFRLPQRLYGREQDVQKLLAALERAGDGALLMMVSGYSGIGKSALIQEVYRPLTRQRGYFASGKFDQYQNHVPYTALTQAFQSLVQQLLTEREERLSDWRERIHGAVRANAQLLVDLCPGLELIIGRQAPIQPLSPADARNRFNQVVREFLSVLASPEHPLCLFFDDVQWADMDSLRLIAELMRSARELPLFLICAYRDNEVGEAHPLTLMLKELEEEGARVERLGVSSLRLENVRALVADTLSATPEEVTSLAELLLARTAGNPFFVRAFLTSLHAHRLLEPTPRGWRWDFERIRQQGITDNVVDLMVDRIRRLPPVTQELLKLAACLGSPFELRTLELLGEPHDGASGHALWPAVAEGLIIPLERVHSAVEMALGAASIRCRFAHDRIQQAVLTLLDARARARLHREVGRRLLRHAGPRREQGFFDVVGQLNQGRAAMEEPAEREELAALNLEAARKALEGAAAERALHHTRAGMTLLQESAWAERYELARDLHLVGAEAAFLCSDLELLEELSRTLLLRARGVMDEVKVLKLQGQVHYSQQRLTEALHTYIDALRRLGFELPGAPTSEEIAAEMRATAEALGERPEELLALPECQEPLARAAMELLNHMVLMAYSLTSGMFSVVICRLVQLSLRYGNTPESTMGYTFLGVLLANAGEIDRGCRLGRQALNLADGFGDKVFLSQSYLYCHYQLLHWKHPLHELTPAFSDAYRYGLEAGSPFYAACAATTLCINRFVAGSDLRKLAADMPGYREVAVKFRQKLVLNWHDIYQQTVMNLVEDTADARTLAGPIYDEAQRLPIHLASKDPSALFNYYYCKAYLCYLFGDYEGAAASADANEPYLPVIGSAFWASSQAFLGALYRLAVHDRASPSERERLLARVTDSQQKLARWLEHCPRSIAHKLHLVEGERARVLGDEARARAAFERGVALARESGALSEEALAFELAARFFLGVGETGLARHHLRSAHHAYLRWGAVAKARALEREYPYLLPRTSFPLLASETLSALGERDFSLLDLMGVLDACQAISREIALDRLLTRLMALLIELGGAEAGCLLLERNGQWVVEAEKALGSEGARVLQSVPVEELEARGYRGLPTSIVYYVARTQECVVLDDASASERFGRDPYISRNRVRSALCLPLSRQAGRFGVVYLENNLLQGVFTQDRIDVLRLLASQAIISLENAVLYETLEQKVEERTLELKVKNEELAATLTRLRETQHRLLVQDRLASLGVMTAGIAHELRNPLHFVNSYSGLSRELLQESLGELSAPGNRLALERMSRLEETLSALEANLGKIEEHGKRMEGIIHSMLEHSREGKSERQDIELNGLLASSVNLAHHGMRSRDPSFSTAIDVEFDQSVGTMGLVPQELSRVIVNILDNACYAVSARRQAAGGEGSPARILVRSRSLGDEVEIRIRDNGVGIPKDIQDKVFTPFFTTKKAGEGTGLGLSISHDIIVKGHGGTLHFESEEGAFTEFIIRLPRQRA